MGSTDIMQHNGYDKECVMNYPTLEDVVGNTPLVRLKRITAGRNNTLLAKLEGNNPAGSVKDRPALSMLSEAEARGDIRPGDTLIEATSGNTGIALAMAAAIKGYKMVLVMPENASAERKQAMAAYGARLISASKEGGMEEARDIADAMIARGEGKPLNQFANPDNPLAHYRTTGPEVWRQTGGEVTHFVSSMGTTGTIMGVSRYLKEQNPAVQIVGLQPADGASIPGIRRWPRSTCLPFSKRRGSTSRWTSPSRKPKSTCVAWPGKRVFWQGFHPAAAWQVRCASPHKPKTRSSCSSSVTVVIAISPRACSPRRFKWPCWVSGGPHAPHRAIRAWHARQGEL